MTLLGTRLPPKHHPLLLGLDRVSRDCNEHQREIFAKLVAIMAELVKGMVERLETAPWLHAPAPTLPTPSSASNIALPVGHLPSPPPIALPPAADDTSVERLEECVRMLMKQTCSLHRALSDLLLPEQRDLVFGQISHLFLANLKECAMRIETKRINALVARKKLAINIHHIVTRYACDNHARTCVRDLRMRAY
jgi:hypothetical protein